MPPTVCVCAEPGRADEADALAARLGLPRGDDADVLLVLTETRRELRVTRADDATLLGGRAVWSDLASIDTASPDGRSRKAPLLKAAWPRRWPEPPRVLDATAGFGEDAWLLAGFGCDVTAVERDAVAFALLEDAVRRAALSSEANAAVAGRLSLVHGDAREVMRRASGARPDVVTVDPMFPAARRATERKAMRVLRLILGDAADPSPDEAASLFNAARGVASRRVIVKRPRKAPPWVDDEPGLRVAGRAIRFDVYETPR